MLGKKNKDSIRVEVTPAERQRIEQLAALTNQSMSALILTCVKFSAHAVRKKYIKDFVEDALAMPDPFDSEPDEPVFDTSGAPYEDRLLASELAYQREQKRPGSTNRKLTRRPTPHDIRAGIDASDIRLANEYERRYGPAGTGNSDDAEPS
jgi:hypothetical protein